MIKTALEHAVIAMLLQFCIAVYLFYIHSFSFEQGILAGGFSASIAFLFREISQHEYKGGGPLKVGILYGLTNHWNLDSMLDVLFPIIATGVTWTLFKLV